MVKHLPAMQESRVQSLGWEDPLEEGMATHSSILAWRITGQRSLEGCSPRGHKELDMTERLSTHRHIPQTHTGCDETAACFQNDLPSHSLSLGKSPRSTALLEWCPLTGGWQPGGGGHVSTSAQALHEHMKVRTPGVGPAWMQHWDLT